MFFAFVKRFRTIARQTNSDVKIFFADRQFPSMLRAYRIGRVSLVIAPPEAGFFVARGKDVWRRIVFRFFEKCPRLIS
jgi:hypothetical protein